ncbi:MAG: methionyl-tRNA formyltransferase [Planctomycetota bacterium]|nr:MAG: methionyl-tRNA formyltransferase [Planctomycetota bacterium]
MAARPRTLFFGSGSVALPALARLLDADLVEVDSVVTAPPRPAGRKGVLTPTPLAEAAVAQGIPVRTPVSLRRDEVLAELRAVGAELIVLVDYGRIIPAAVLGMPRHGALNIHPSLLPRHRGAAPVQGAILAADETTGVTLMCMDEGLDTGPIVAQVEMPLDGSEVAPELEERLAQMGADLLIEHLPAWLDGSLTARPQSEEGATLTRPLRREDGRLDPERPALELERQVRAYQPWPGSFLEIDGARVKVWRSGVLAQSLAVVPGEIILAEEAIALGTVDGVLRLDEVQPAGKRRMSGADYRRGRRL